MIRQMKMDLTDPCGSCPFRTDWDCHLDPKVADNMVKSVREGNSLACWETVGEYDDNGLPVYSEHEQHCAGALIILEKNRYMPRPPWMRFMQKIGRYRPSLLNMAAPVFGQFYQFVDAMKDTAALDRVAGMMEPVACEARVEEAA